MTNSNFFDAIGVADMEKVHSAVIGWMLSDKCDAFDSNGKKAKSKLLQDIFQVKEPERVKEFESIKVITEWKNIDILVVTELDNVKKCWVIENKIKSSQHSNQLKRYENSINCEYLLSSRQYQTVLKQIDNPKEESIVQLINQRVSKWKPLPPFNHYNAVEKKYCLLTLIGEGPNSNLWVNTLYSQLLESLEQVLELGSNNVDFQFVKAYCDCVKNMLDALNDFKTQHMNYPNVFTDGKLRKEAKNKELLEGYALYISENGLETIFQKCFLSEIIPNKIKDKKGFVISETQGTALAEYPYSITNGTKIAFQFQDGSFKIQVSRVTENDNRLEDSVLDQKREKFRKFWTDQLARIRGLIKYPETWRINHSNAGNEIYISLSCPHGFWPQEQPIWYKNQIDIIKSSWIRAHEVCDKILKDVNTVAETQFCIIVSEDLLDTI